MSFCNYPYCSCCRRAYSMGVLDGARLGYDLGCRDGHRSGYVTGYLDGYKKETPLLPYKAEVERYLPKFESASLPALRPQAVSIERTVHHLTKIDPMPKSALLSVRERECFSFLLDGDF